MIFDAFDQTALLVWNSWPEWSREQPILWVLPAAAVLRVVGAFLPKRHVSRRRR